MKRLSLLSLVIVLAFSSCKKDENSACDISLTAIAGNYKVTKVTAAGIDVTGDVLTDDCLKNGIITLGADGSAVYTQGAGCTGGGTGSWSLSTDGKITINTDSDFDDVSAATVNNTCSSLIITKSYMGVSYSTTLTKQ